MSDAGASDVAERLAAVRRRIAAAAERVGRDPSEVTLVGVSKRVAPERIVAAVAAGLEHLGESYAQEARDKIPAVHDRLDARGLARPCWHFVGRLQRNKARDVVRDFHCVESVDRLSLARALDERAGKASRRIDVLIQVNLSGEPQKGGAAPEALPELLAGCSGLAHLRATGLMTVPAAALDPEAGRPVFARLRELRDGLRGGPGGAELSELSMGMSGDFEVAVEEGATRVRVGTALFGPRNTAEG